MIDDKATVGLTYCNGTEFLHEHPTVVEAFTEYGQVLGELLEPTGENNDKVHLRVITMTFFDAHNRVHTLDSGVFPCEHSG
jgi:hypothetical protein